LSIPWLLGEKRQSLWGIAKLYLLFFIPFNFIILTLLAIDHGKLRFSTYNLVRLLVPLIYLVGILILWASGKVSVKTVVVINFLATAIMAIIRLFMEGFGFLSVPLLTEVKALIKNSLGFHCAVVLTICATQVDKFFILWRWDDWTMGIYMVAFTIASSGLNVVGNTFHIVLFPSIARTPQDQRADKMTEGIRQAMLMIIITMIPLMILSPYIIPLIFGKAFQPSGVVSVYLIMAFSLMSLKNIKIRCFRGFGEGFPGAVAELISVIVYLVTVIPLSSKLNIVGICVALGFGNVSALVYLFYYARSKHNIPIKSWWGLERATVEQFYEAMKGLINR
ncbi:MAG: oligosaccharide flippase family protein, partial [Candidatus Aminicenantes bacterium]|nr:oligosaccharide flippase family protein [Candidatus Aminicenantes bacterium]NIT29636.1 oligosaccharide flippase family protein [Candidatus Aminicenantes bacterium]